METAAGDAVVRPRRRESGSRTSWPVTSPGARDTQPDRLGERAQSGGPCRARLGPDRPVCGFHGRDLHCSSLPAARRTWWRSNARSIGSPGRSSRRLRRAARLSGHLAGAAVLMALCRPGDVVLEVGRDGGGHREAGKFAGSELVRLEVRHLPIDDTRYNVDPGAAAELIAETKPRCVILGSSNFLFPHPVREIRRALPGCRRPISCTTPRTSWASSPPAASRIPRRGRRIVFGSTHKTFPGRRRDRLHEPRGPDRAVSDVVYPGLVTTTTVPDARPRRRPGEVQAFGAAYATGSSPTARRSAKPWPRSVSRA